METQAQEYLERLKKAHPKARHFCYSYRLGLDKNNFRSNDDGEPSGTAGKPILGQIDSFGLTNVFVVVVRYFGGTLLGTSGLINAYRQSTHDALQNATIVEQTIEDVFQLSFSYALMPDVMNAVKKLDITMLKQAYGDHASLEISIRQGVREHVFTLLKAHIAKVSVEEAAQMEALEGLDIVFLHST